MDKIKGKVITMKKFTKIVSLALALVCAVSVFSTAASAKTVRGYDYKRALTQEEIVQIYSIFDAEFYAAANRDVMDYYGYKVYSSDCDFNLFSHFINYGIWEERQPNALFNVDVFATRNVDLRKEYGDDIIAYYIYYATYPTCYLTRGNATWGEAYRRNVDVYSVYDFNKGDGSLKAGALPMQTANYAPELGIGVK